MSSEPDLINASRSKRGFSRVGNYFKCIRRGAFSTAYPEDRAKEPPSDPLIRGSLLHMGLAHHYARLGARRNKGGVHANGKLYTDPDQLHPPATAVMLLAEQEGPEWEARIEVVLLALKSYIQKYGDDLAWEVVAVEHEYVMTLPETVTLRGPKGEEYDNPYPPLSLDRRLYTQRADLVIRDRASGMIWIPDHKSAYQLLSKTARQYILHGQFLGYAAIGKKVYKEKFAGVLLNRVKLSPFDADRMPVEAAPAAVAGYVRNLVLMEQQIAMYEDRNLPPELWPGAFHEEVCFSKYGQCPFMARCQWGGTAEQAALMHGLVSQKR